MFIVYGNHAYGRVEPVAGTTVRTLFWHVMWVPIIPLESFVRADDDPDRRVLIRLHGRSVLASYLRTWCPGLLVWWALLEAGSTEAFDVTKVSNWLAVVALIALTAAGWFALGPIASGEVARRGVYGRFAGFPVDVARLPREHAAKLRDYLDAAFAHEGRGLGSTYRDGLDPVRSWQALAGNPATTHRLYLEAALTRARLEQRWATRQELHALRTLHEAIWTKLIESSRRESVCT